MPDPFQQSEKVSQWKLSSFQYVIIAILLVLVGGLWKLQILDTQNYRALAEQNRIRKVPVLAPRGRIVDREGRLLVDNYVSTSCFLLREQVHDLDADLPMIARGLNVSEDYIRSTIRHYGSRPKYEPIPLKQDISPDEVEFIEAHRNELPELETLDEPRRLYPTNGFGAHLIGYVGEVSEEMLDDPKYEFYEPGDVVGKAGVEETYDEVLRGKDGSRDVVVNSHGKEIGVLGSEPSVPGKMLKLTVDLDIQKAAEEALGERSGAIVAWNPRNGEVLALVSHPAYDPNDFAVKIHRDEWNKLLTDPNKPLMDKAIQAQLAPGSTFKIIMSVAGLQENIAETMHVFCTGGASFYGHYFKCDEKHGAVDIHKAIPASCDTFFYTLAQKLGIDKIAYWAHQFGLGQRTGIDLPDEVSGTMPSEEWKLKNYHEKWYAGETISVGIGQGAIAATPVQMLRAISGIASGGELKRPHVVAYSDMSPEMKQALEDNGGSGDKYVPISAENWETITDAMTGTVAPGGTAASAHLDGIDFAGKTGSAQTVSNEGRAHGLGAHMRDNAWFVGLAPRRNPEIAVVILWEGGMKGFYSARRAALVIEAYVDKQRRLANNIHEVAQPVQPPAPVGTQATATEPADPATGAKPKTAVPHKAAVPGATATPQTPATKQAPSKADDTARLEMGAVWNESFLHDAKMRGGHFSIGAGAKAPDRLNAAFTGLKPVSPQEQIHSCCERWSCAQTAAGRPLKRSPFSLHDFDWLLFSLVLALSIISVFEIYSATLHTKFAGFQRKQILWLLAGMALMFIFSRLNYHVLVDKIYWVYGFCLASLVGVAVVGTKVMGARRWIKLPGGGHFQPSEWVKIVLIISVARYFSNLGARDGLTWKDIAKAFALVGVPMLLVLKEPDLGTALTYLPVLLCGLFLGGIRWKQALILAVAGAILVVPVWYKVLKPYQKQRLTSFRNPDEDPRGSGYQVKQSLIAVGDGGLWGRGATKGTQTQGDFLPIPYTDFIFAAFCEEHGFVGAVFVLLLYFFVLMRLIQNAQTAADLPGALLVMGVVAVLIFQIAVNVGMVVGLMPVTGIPLPLMSYGGSSVLFTFLALGIVMNVRMSRFVN